MKMLDANSWENYDEYVAEKTAKIRYAEKKRLTKKEKEKKLKDKNSTMRGIAKHYAKGMQKGPSVLEERMQKLLDKYKVVYEFQKPLYIKKRDKAIRKFYIADFYVPSRNLIIETDGKFHDNQLKQDAERTKDIQKQYPNMKVLRWRWHDFDFLQKLEILEKALKISNIF